MSCIVERKSVDVYTRLRAQIGIPKQIGNMFLGYCSIHKSYFLDVKHTNGEIRCPVCDKNWLKKYLNKKKEVKH